MRYSPVDEADSLIHPLVRSLAAAALLLFPATASAELGQTAVPLLGATSALAIGDCAPEAGWPAERADAQQLVQLVNQHRAGLSPPAAPLGSSPALTASAAWKARHMARYGYMAHDDPAPPVARSFFDRIQACGFFGSAGENIGFGYPSPQAIMQGWLDSPGHRANIEGPGFTVIGVGGAGTHWTQDFGVVNASALAVTFRSLSAGRVQGGVRVTWRTASELDTLGYRVYREANGRRVRVNGKLIAAKGRGSYAFLDRKAPRAKSVRYWIQVVDTDGSRSWYGPARVFRT